MKYKRMGLMVCFSFMVDGFEDTWLFISAQKVELTDFHKNQLTTVGRVSAFKVCAFPSRSRRRSPRSSSLGPAQAWLRPREFTPRAASWGPRRRRLLPSPPASAAAGPAPAPASVAAPRPHPLAARASLEAPPAPATVCPASRM